MTDEQIIVKQTREIENLKEVIRDFKNRFGTIADYLADPQSNKTPQVTLNKITHQLPR
jgi:hypothetical protein